MTVTEILASYEADEIDFMTALELSGCGSLIELYEGAADEQSIAPPVKKCHWPVEGHA